MFGEAQSGALLSTGSLTHMNITLPFVSIIMPYVRCKIVPHFHLMFLFVCFCVFSLGGVLLQCIHDIFNVTMVFPLVLNSVMGEHLLRTCQIPKSVTQCFNLMINNHENGLV